VRAAVRPGDPCVKPLHGATIGAVARPQSRREVAREGIQGVGSANGAGLKRDPYFVGREDVLDAIVEATTGGDSLVVYDIHGPGGIGKTTLIAECAARISESQGCRLLQVSLVRQEPGPIGASG